MQWISRRDALRRATATLAAGAGTAAAATRADEAIAEAEAPMSANLRITELRVTPIALPDPPILAAGGCHGPYFLRNIIEIDTDEGVVGIAETRGGETVTKELMRARDVVRGQSAFAYRKLATALKAIGNATYAGVELACLDAVGRATNRRLCELLGGPVREEVEFASYLFFRYAADHPRVLDDERLVDARGTGAQALDAWGEVRSPEAMGELAWKFHQRWGFRVHKLKAGVFSPDMELAALRAINDRFAGKHALRIDPNARWSVKTALRIAKPLADLPLEYYEDPVATQADMAALVRRETGLRTATNMCVTRFDHLAEAIQTVPINVVLGDHHGWGGITAFQSLGTIAETLGWGVSQHSNNHAGITMAAMIHVGAVTPQLTHASDTHYVWLPEGADVIEGANLPIKDGRMAVPTGPGIGVALDRDKLAQAHEAYVKSGIRERDDAATMRRFEPGWKRGLL